MKKQGSFLFREYKVPDRTEIQEAIAAQIPSDKSIETNILAAAANESAN